jgi:dTDP-4-dehydrorhamnose 3,5-epimerase/CDP-3, 6-dideoxy-D-glycero-D-glycero-4-hexulose-5-epimerase
LSEDDNYILFLPKGIAHGFKSLENDTELLYMVTSNYSEENDTGIHYNSFGFNWESENPILSERDLSFSHLKKFKTPFL